MSDEVKYIITCRFPEWESPEVEGDGVTKYPPFGVKYLFISKAVEVPDWDENDERWFS